MIITFALIFSFQLHWKIYAAFCPSSVAEAANSIPGVKAAANGELNVEGLEVKTMDPALNGGDSVSELLTCVSDVRKCADMFRNVRTRQNQVY